MTKVRKEPFGRPTIYTPELVEKILNVVSTHECGLKKCCSMYDWMPNYDTIVQWRAKYDDFSVLYLTARQKQSHLLAERTNELAEEINEFIYEDPETGAQCINAGIVAMQKLKINSKTWLASRLEPKVYGTEKRIQELEDENTRYKEEIAAIRDKLDKANVSDY